PGASPPPGSVMLFERSRAGRVGHSVLNTGEETKLDREATQPERRHEDFLKAKAALGNFSVTGSQPDKRLLL
ncbi:MAG: hypothetical protein ABSD76_05825, partial [Terriglobales bacterium]